MPVEILSDDNLSSLELNINDWERKNQDCKIVHPIQFKVTVEPGHNEDYEPITVTWYYAMIYYTKIQLKDQVLTYYRCETCKQQSPPLSDVEGIRKWIKTHNNFHDVMFVITKWTSDNHYEE